MGDGGVDEGGFVDELAGLHVETPAWESGKQPARSDFLIGQAGKVDRLGRPGHEAPLAVDGEREDAFGITFSGQEHSGGPENQHHCTGSVRVKLDVVRNDVVVKTLERDVDELFGHQQPVRVIFTEHEKKGLNPAAAIEQRRQA